MKILAFAESVYEAQKNESKFKKVAFEAAHAATQFAPDAEIFAIAIGKGVERIAPELGGYGIKKVYVVDDDRLTLYSTTAYSKILASAAESLSV